MGFYVNISASDFVIPEENVDEAYDRLIALNQRDDLKRGGSWGGECDARSPRPEGYDYHPGKWFSWMDADYPSKCRSLADIFIQLGFEVEVKENGDVFLADYDNKTGQEDIFLDEIIDLARGEITWYGEDNSCWTTVAGVKENVIDRFLALQERLNRSLT
jgi:hypothetical protein